VSTVYKGHAVAPGTALGQLVRVDAWSTVDVGDLDAAFATVGADLDALAARLRAGLEGVQKLGAAVQGDKTIVDASEPAIAAFDAAVAGGGDLHAAAEAARQAAEEGMHATTPLQARKGRASYLGARSVGHQDPGSTSTWLIFKALAEVTA
jgi:dihydroxyacetone kinase-like protein